MKCLAGYGARNCRNCDSSGLICTYNSVPQKKGPKGNRAKVISELRETQRQSQLSTQSHGSDSPPDSPTFSRKPCVLSRDMITACVEYFFANMYPTMPILHRQTIGNIIDQMDADLEAYCLVASLCAYMLIQPNMELRPEAAEGLDCKAESNLPLGRTLLADAIRTRKRIDYIEFPSAWSVITSFFFFGSHFCLDLHGTAWFHLREATTLALTLRMHEQATYRSLDRVECIHRRRLYWLLFVTERAYALQQHRPLTLYATINFPSPQDEPEEAEKLDGFLHMVKLYRPFDDSFVGLWNKAKTGCTTEWLAQVQQQLSDALPVYLQGTESQAVDVKVSQKWLRTLVWQLSMSHGYLSSAAADKAMSFQFPIEISRDLVAVTAQFSQQAMEVHGIGLVSSSYSSLVPNSWDYRVTAKAI